MAVAGCNETCTAAAAAAGAAKLEDSVYNYAKFVYGEFKKIIIRFLSGTVISLFATFHTFIRSLPHSLVYRHRSPAQAWDVSFIVVSRILGNKICN